MKISAYYRKDYASLHTLYSIIWVTIGYICAIVLIALGGLEMWMEKMTMGFMITLGIVVVAGYVVVLIVYAVVSNRIYNKKHRESRTRVKKYNHDLTRLLKIYEKENQ